ncbi:unnamed protein product, partial [Ectocarpus sp. 12 AP-2014]
GRGAGAPVAKSWGVNGYPMVGGDPGSGVQRRRSRSVDSTPATPHASTVIASPGAEGVASKDSDDGEESSGGSRSFASIVGRGGGG